MRTLHTFTRLVVIALVIASLPAHDVAATYVCTVQQSPDGFVALRDKPSEDGEMITKAQPGDAIVIQQKTNGDWIEDGKWVSVFHYPGEVIPEESDPEYSKGKTGWMHRSFVSDCG